MGRKLFVTLRLRYTVQRRAKFFFATCHFMDVLGQGASEDEAIESMKAEIDVLFEFCADRRTLVNLLVDRSSKYSPPFSIYRDLRIEAVENVRDEPEWANIQIDPSIIDQVSNADQKTRKP
ncbi:MAG: hypothetical protein IIC13_07460 [SAR324 cluster bacterium]|nr:hypothetical protein [SAR324 cluster bacterium]